MMLGLYLGSTGYVIHKVFKIFKNYRLKLQEEGYVFTDDSLSSSEIKDFFISCILLLFPILNLTVMFGIILFKEKGYEIIKNKLLKNNKIKYTGVPNKEDTKNKDDYSLKQDEELMKYNFAPEDIEFLKKLHEKQVNKETNNTDYYSKQYIITDSPKEEYFESEPVHYLKK